MTIRELQSSGLYDENEKIAIIKSCTSNSNLNCVRVWKGFLEGIPSEYLDKTISLISALGLSECEKSYYLPVSRFCGWTGIFIEEE